MLADEQPRTYLPEEAPEGIPLQIMLDGQPIRNGCSIIRDGNRFIATTGSPQVMPLAGLVRGTSFRPFPSD